MDCMELMPPLGFELGSRGAPIPTPTAEVLWERWGCSGELMLPLGFERGSRGTTTPTPTAEVLWER